MALFLLLSYTDLCPLFSFSRASGGLYTSIPDSPSERKKKAQEEIMVIFCFYIVDSAIFL